MEENVDILAIASIFCERCADMAAFIPCFQFLMEMDVALF
jgi:hypothetical protein